MAITVSELLKMSQEKLDEIFTDSPAGEIPDGEAKGTAIIAPGTSFSDEIAEFISHWIRDEIREVAPNLYLGKVYWGKRRLIDFAIDFNK